MRSGIPLTGWLNNDHAIRLQMFEPTVFPGKKDFVFGNCICKNHHRVIYGDNFEVKFWNNNIQVVLPILESKRPLVCISELSDIRFFISSNNKLPAWHKLKFLKTSL